MKRRKIKRIWNLIQNIYNNALWCNNDEFLNYLIRKLTEINELDFNRENHNTIDHGKLQQN